MSIGNQPDYDQAGHLAAVDEIARQLRQFELSPVTPERLSEAMAVLDLLAASAMDARPGPIPGPPYDIVKLRQRDWASHYADTFSAAYDAVNRVANRQAVLP